MNRLNYFIVTFILGLNVLFFPKYALSIPPVDITLLTIELKYDEKNEIKICEIQPVCHSTFDGCDYLYQREGVIGKRLCDYLSSFGKFFCFMGRGVPYQPMKKQLLLSGWKSLLQLEELFLPREFALNLPEAVKLVDYQGIVYGNFIFSKDSQLDLCAKFPDVVFIDRMIAPYMCDKYSQHLLFSGCPILEKVKPIWGIFPKVYSETLTQEILNQVGGDRFVIKPRSAFRGDGVVIVDKENLDDTLQLILTPREKLQKHPDRGYRYWLRDQSTNFLVERFICAEPTVIKEFNDQLFDVTFRLAVALVYEDETLYLHFLGSYCNLSDKSLEEEGSLNEKYKTSLLASMGVKTPPLIEKNIHQQLTIPLLLLYKRILGFDLNCLEEGLESAIVTEYEEQNS